MRLHWLAVLCPAALSCVPEFDDRPYLIDQPRLIAVIATPPEARPGEVVTLTPVVAGRGSGTISLRFCRQARPLADPRPIAETCLDDPGVDLEPHGNGARGMIPADACARFGPDRASGTLRPVDADATGGFYQPVIVDGFGEPSAALVRIHCSLPNAPAELARELEERYTLNQNPKLAGLEAAVDGAFESDFTLRAGKPVSLRVSWPDASREPYVWLPPDGSAVEPRLEALRVSWFVSSGVLAASATGGDAGEAVTYSENTFTPDSGAARVNIWVVLQDSRGGSAAKRWQLRVEP